MVAEEGETAKIFLKKTAKRVDFLRIRDYNEARKTTVYEVTDHVDNTHEKSNGRTDPSSCFEICYPLDDYGISAVAL